MRTKSSCGRDIVFGLEKQNDLMRLMLEMNRRTMTINEQSCRMVLRVRIAKSGLDLQRLTYCWNSRTTHTVEGKPLQA